MEGWTEHVDTNSGNTFYYNSTTGETSWAKPTSASESVNDSTAAVPPATLPSDWAEHVDPASGCTFYCNIVTNETTWERPKAEAPQQEQGQQNQPADVPKLLEGWSESLDPASGQTFYFNAATGESRWDMPTAGAVTADTLPTDWAQLSDPNTGKVYYYNSVTGESSWEKPAVGSEATAAKASDTLAPISQQPLPSRGDIVAVGGDGAALKRDIQLPGERLGQGSFGTAYRVRERASGRNLVLKTVVKQSCANHERMLALREVDILRALDHPHVVRIFGCYEDFRCIYVLMDLAEGGELVRAIEESRKKRHPVNEGWAATVLQQVIGAIAYCHDRGVMHKDLKCENIMLLNAPPAGKSILEVAPHAVIIDLGLAELFTNARAKSSLSAGTCTTMAPEVWQGNFGPKCDVWSLGCVLFELLSGRTPFLARKLEDGSEWLRLHRAGPDWRLLGHASPEARQLCEKMLDFDQRSRPGAKQCLGANWLKHFAGCANGTFAAGLTVSSSQQPFQSALVGAFENWRERSEFQNAVSFQIAANLSSGSVEELNAVFRSFDRDRSGTLSPAELDAALRKLGLDASATARAIATMDTNGDGKCEYTEFLATCLSALEERYDDFLWEAFRRIDLDGNGFLSQDEVRRVFRTMATGPVNHKATAAATAAALCTIDVNKDGKISFEEFLSHFGRGKGSSRSGKESSLLTARKTRVSVPDALNSASTTSVCKANADPDIDSLLNELDTGSSTKAASASMNAPIACPGKSMHQVVSPLKSMTAESRSHGQKATVDTSDLDALLADLG